MSLDRQSKAVAHSTQSPARKLRIGFIHPDLGIGGAERLVVDAALGLQKYGHEVVIFTSHHDPNHCFEATRDGTLKVHLMRTIVPRSLFNRFHLPLAILQQASLIFQLLLSLLLFKFPGTMPQFVSSRLTSAPPMPGFDLFFIDQLSAGIPWLRILSATRVVFYCHFPDKEIGRAIAKQRAAGSGGGGPSVLRKLYRIPLDLYEEATTDSADKILVNSEFTAQQFIESFYRLRRAPRVLYPGIDTSTYDPAKVEAALAKLESEGEQNPVKAAIKSLVQATDRPTLISINRFEAKKNVSLAIEAFAIAQKAQASEGKLRGLRLIIAGGYDRRVKDNIETLDYLQKLATSQGLSHMTLSYAAQKYEPPVSAPPAERLQSASVIFLPSVPGPLLHTLLLAPSTRALLYTPEQEHFGIVPLEAMVCGVPVLAVNSGGPMESVVDAGASPDGLSAPDGTGLLRHPSAPIWGIAIETLLDLSEEDRTRLAHEAKDRVEKMFSLEAMSEALENAMYETDKKGPVSSDEGLLQWGSTIGVFVAMMTTYIGGMLWADWKRHAAAAAAASASQSAWEASWSASIATAGATATAAAMSSA